MSSDVVTTKNDRGVTISCDMHLMKLTQFQLNKMPRPLFPGETFLSDEEF
jgi:hypothetical protein